MERSRRLPVGAELMPGQGVHVRVWAPERTQVEVVLEGPEPRRIALSAERCGYFSGWLPGVGEGTLYRFSLDGEGSYADPASRFQPEGPFGPSQVIDPARFEWTDRSWQGLNLAGLVLYEMHVGTFTREGTWRAAQAQLEELARLGITAVEILPIADFPGRFGWGYDGVNWFAPTRLYGHPDDFRSFVSTAHRLGLGVILDVVYNHCGASGCFLREFATEYFSQRHQTEWGPALNFDGERAYAVRDYVATNASYWIDEFHLDGLRIDATQQIFDESPEHILVEINRAAHEGAKGRSIVLIAENEPQQIRMVRPIEQGGIGLDAVWNEDFHHIAMVAATGRTEGYYHDYRGAPQEFISALKRGFLYQGQRYLWQKKRRGSPTKGVRPAVFVNYLQNHDQIANDLRARRLHKQTSPGRYRAITAIWLLAPQTPLMFQGQEFAASTPFHYFGDFEPELADKVREGQLHFREQFRSVVHPETHAYLADPADPATFERSKLDFADRVAHADTYALHQDLLALRRNDPVFRSQASGGLDGAVLGPEAFVIRYFDEQHDDRLLLVNFGRDLLFGPCPEPLLAPPEGQRWAVLWSSENPRYGGTGCACVETQQGWLIPAEAAIVLIPQALEDHSDGTPDDESGAVEPGG